jgi:hypothetical protein
VRLVDLAPSLSDGGGGTGGSGGLPEVARVNDFDATAFIARVAGEGSGGLEAVVGVELEVELVDAFNKASSCSR